MTGIVAGKVVDVHPEHNSVDVRVLSDRRRLIGVPVAGIGNTGTTGTIDLPVPDLTTGRGEDEKWKSTNTDERDVIAIIAFVGGAPVCLGFMHPPITEMTFEGEDAKERRLFRHASDFYSFIDRDANVEVAHPSGTWFALSEKTRKTRLTEQDYDRKWQVKRNLKRAVHGIISWWNGAEKERGRLHMTPEGDLSLWLNERVTITVGADGGAAASITLDADGNVTVLASGKVRLGKGRASSAGATVDTPSFQPSETPPGEVYHYDGAPVATGDADAYLEIDGAGITLKGDLSVDGDIVGTGSLSVAGPAHAAAHI